LETHLGWAAKGLGIKIGKMLEARYASGKRKSAIIRGFLEKFITAVGAKKI
jgi:DNA-directed RNA polymerase subunit beta